MYRSANQNNTPVPGVGTADRYERSEADKIMLTKYAPNPASCSFNAVTENYIGPRTEFDVKLQNKWTPDPNNCAYNYVKEQFDYNNGLQDPYNSWTYQQMKKLFK